MAINGVYSTDLYVNKAFTLIANGVNNTGGEASFVDMIEVSPITSQRVQEKAIADMQLFDADGDGTVTMDEIADTYVSNDIMDEKQAKYLTSKFDVDGDGKLSVNEEIAITMMQDAYDYFAGGKTAKETFDGKIENPEEALLAMANEEGEFGSKWLNAYSKWATGLGEAIGIKTAIGTDVTDPIDPAYVDDPTSPTNPDDPTDIDDPTNPTNPDDPTDVDDPTNPDDPEDAYVVDPNDPNNEAESYTVKSGDFLYSIISDYGLEQTVENLDILIAANPFLTEESRVSEDKTYALIKPGENIFIPEEFRRK